MKTIIIYLSKTGFTKEYALMLSEQLKCEARPFNQRSQVNLEAYDTIIYGGGIRATKINGLSSMVKSFKKLQDKAIIIFAVGATENSETYVASVYTKNFEENHLDYPLFYLQGGFDPERLGFFMKSMLRKVAASIKKKAEKDPASITAKDNEFLDFFQSAHTNVNAKNLQALVDHIQGLA